MNVLRGTRTSISSFLGPRLNRSRSIGYGVPPRRAQPSRPAARIHASPAALRIDDAAEASRARSAVGIRAGTAGAAPAPEPGIDRPNVSGIVSAAAALPVLVGRQEPAVTNIAAPPRQRFEARAPAGL